MGNDTPDNERLTSTILPSLNNSISSKNDILDSNTISTSDGNKICPYPIKESTKLQHIISIQSYFRGFINRKKFEDDLELLINILQLDSTVNLIKDENLKKELLLNNKGECLSNELVNNKSLIPYQNTNYYKANIKKYKLSKFLLQTPLTYIDKFKNSNMYIGTWTLDKRFQGYGIFYAYGNKYEGFWDHGKLKGQCRYFLNNGDYFVGSFKDGKANGYGKYFYKDGSKYEGEWKNDQPNGKGIEKSDDLYFKGIFSEGIKVSGFFKWDDGSFYEGQVKNNNFHGKGKFHWKEGNEYIGEWKYGKMNGKGVMNYLDGTKYEGYFVDGKIEEGSKYMTNEKKNNKMSWENAEQNWKERYSNRRREIEGVFKKGMLINNSVEKIDIKKQPHRFFKFSNSFSKLYQPRNTLRDNKYNTTKIDIDTRRSNITKKISTIKKKSRINKIIVFDNETSNETIRNISLTTENISQNITDYKAACLNSINSRNFSVGTTLRNHNKNSTKKKKLYINKDFKKSSRHFFSCRCNKNPFIGLQSKK